MIISPLLTDHTLTLGQAMAASAVGDSRDPSASGSNMTLRMSLTAVNPVSDKLHELQNTGIFMTVGIVVFRNAY